MLCFDPHLHLSTLFRETVVSPVLLVPWEFLVPLDLVAPLELLADLETVESLYVQTAMKSLLDHFQTEPFAGYTTLT